MTRPDLSELAADVGTIRAIALDVLHDPAGADDVVQDALLAAWVNGVPELGDSARRSERMRAWVRRCARNTALQRVRRARRRERREASAARPEAQPSAAEVLDRVALQRHVAAAVESLPEPDREIVALRYWEGLPPRAIARRLGLSPSAVSTRLTRAKASLRRELDEPQSSSGVAWGLVAARWPSPTPAPAAPSLPAAPSSPGGSRFSPWLPAGAIAVKKSLLLASGALAVLLLGLATLPTTLLQREDESRSDSVQAVDLALPGPTAIADLGDESLSGRMPVAPGLADRAAAEPPPAALAVATGAIEVEVVDGSTGEGAQGIGLHAFVPSSDTWFDSRRAVTDASGRVRFDDVPPGHATVYIHRLTQPSGFGAEKAQVTAGETVVVRFSVVPGATIHGTVRDALGRPVAGAEVWLGNGTGANQEGDVVTTTDASGDYVIRHAAKLQMVAARAPGHAPSRARMALRAEEDALGHRVDLELLGPGGTTRGLVLSPAGRPESDALVVIGDAGSQESTREGGELTWDPPPLVLRTDGEGRFGTDCMGAGSIPIRARGRSSGVVEAEVLVPVGGTATPTLRLEPAATLYGVVRTDRGTVVGGARLSSSAFDDTLSRFDAVADDEGRYEISSLSPGRVEVEVESESEGAALRTTIEVLPGERKEWDPVLATPVDLTGRVVAEGGGGLSGWRVTRRARSSENPRADGTAYTDPSGRFAFEGCPDLVYSITVLPPGRIFGEPAAALEDVSPSADSVSLVVRADSIPTVGLVARFVDGEGGPLAVAIELDNPSAVELEDVVHLRAESDSAGVLRLEHLGAGTYSLRIQSEGLALRDDLEPFELSEGPAFDLGTLVVVER